jgi:polar amino acid transport system substrate-binding protein
VRLKELAVIVALALVLTTCAPAPATVPSATTRLAVPEITESGNLRIAVNSGVSQNVLGSGEIADEIGKELGKRTIIAREVGQLLASRIGVKFTLMDYATDAALLQAAGAWDVGFPAMNSVNEPGNDLASAPYMELDYTYLVAGGSPLHAAADANKPGVRIALQRQPLFDRAFSGAAPQATLVRTERGSDGLELVRSGQVDAFAHNRQELLVFANHLSGSRVFEDRFSVTRIGALTAKARVALTSYVIQAIEELKSDGSVAAALRRTDIRGLKVAPPVR